MIIQIVIIQNKKYKINVFKVLQNNDSAFYDMVKKEKRVDANWFIDRLQFELFVVGVLAFYGKKNILI